jgi:hypothetical protein
MIEKLEKKSPLASKKFIASMLWSICWLILIAMGIHLQIDAEVLSSMVWICGSVQGLYLGGQSFVDGLVRKAMAGRTTFSATAEPEE